MHFAQHHLQFFAVWFPSWSACTLSAKPRGHQLACSPSVANVSLAESPQVVYLFEEAKAGVNGAGHPYSSHQWHFISLFCLFLFFWSTSCQWNGRKFHALHGWRAVAPLCLWPPSVSAAVMKKNTLEAWKFCHTLTENCDLGNFHAFVSSEMPEWKQRRTFLAFLHVNGKKPASATPALESVMLS